MPETNCGPVSAAALSSATVAAMAWKPPPTWASPKHLRAIDGGVEPAGLTYVTASRGVAPDPAAFQTDVPRWRLASSVSGAPPWMVPDQEKRT
ncbi:hypothetical protein Q5752_003628 [Cryptotrichosporon argae]